jgi:general secretion pathway protein A
MYRDFFNIDENPFSNTPDPKYLFMSPRHKEALAHLIYGVKGESGFVLLTGEVGTGKTTLCRYLAEHLPKKVELALCINPRLSEAELLASICDDFGIQTQGSLSTVKGLTDLINTYLLDLYAQGKRAVLIIDEAQNLRFEMLEQVRLLTNLETANNKLLQIILIGQSELKDYVDQEKLRQLSQRITARYHLDPMSVQDSKDYIAHRIHVSGLDEDVFSPGAITEICRQSRGIPRLINSICERCLLGAYAKDTQVVTRKLALIAAKEVLGKTVFSPERPLTITFLGLFIGAMALMYLAINPLGTKFPEQINRSSPIIWLRSRLAVSPLVAPYMRSGENAPATAKPKAVN